MVQLLTALGLTTEYRANFRGIYRAVEPLNHITLTDEPPSCQATKIYAFTCSLNFILLHLFLHLSYTVNPLLSYPGQGRSQDFSKGGSPSGDRRLYMVYTAALPRVSAGSVILLRHEGPY